ncbi:hypothetical protein GCM10007242_45220 [Pigmentiphaga litoralis]|uniref:deoxynucleotide monophosphate kinase family protein n=1 Tax=Pigmentiphaga litoralis TaxID=516702 RepID=UPI001676B23D|nr:hypothetical protein [Pigmentiphaga litoralis]GGX33099.1 hypothetical protein GCM10007242_45220 [Pigmentiphaga litoralis]
MHSPYEIIGLVGRAGSGKNTCADGLLSIAGFEPMAFADPVRAEISEAFGTDPQLLLDRKRKEVPAIELAIGRCADGRYIGRMNELGLNGGSPRSPRQTMQLYGTEYRRQMDGEDYWADQMKDAIGRELSAGHHRLVITDVRFLSEAALLKRIGASLWRVKRSSADALPITHVSEAELDHIQCDYVVVNDARLVDYHEVVAETYAAFLADRQCGRAA